MRRLVFVVCVACSLASHLLSGCSDDDNGHILYIPGNWTPPDAGR